MYWRGGVSPRGPQKTGKRLVSAAAVGARPADFGDVEIDVVADEKIEMAVSVVVDESAAGTPARPFVQQARRLLSHR